MKNGCRFTRQTLAGRAAPAPTDYRFTDPMALYTSTNSRTNHLVSTLTSIRQLTNQLIKQCLFRTVA